VLSSSDENTSASAGRNKEPTSASMNEDVVKDSQIEQEPEDMSSSNNRAYTPSTAPTLPPMSALSDLKKGSRASLSFKQIETLAQKSSMESEIEKQLVLSLPSDLQLQVRTSSNVRESLIQAVKDGQVLQPNEQLVACLQRLDDKMTENNELASRIMDLVSENRDHLAQIKQLQQELASKQDEMKQLQIQALDRLAQLQNNVQALLTQTYELHEYPIPRLFIVLPDDRSSWNPLDFFSNKFRLYFLCECGEHTKATKSNIPHRIHLAKHQGYDIERPNEFFQQYGLYVLMILKMLKLGISVAGVAVPALSNLIPDALDQATESLKLLTNTIEPGMDQVISHIEKVSTDDGGIADGSSSQMENNEALEGADLRQLETFLKNKDKERVLGNLYRIVTTEGHVKWVCIDHYRENYHEKDAIAFRNAVDVVGGSFDENAGRVDVKLLSRVQAEQFYGALKKARSVYELVLQFDWETSQSDLKMLRDTLAATNVGVLELYLWNQGDRARDILNRSQRYDPVLDIMRHPSLKSFTIRGPLDFSKRSGLLSRNDDFSNLRHLNLSHDLFKDIPGVKCLITKATNIASLTVGPSTLRNDVLHALEACNAVAKHRTYPINVREWDLSIPSTPKESMETETMTAHQRMEHVHVLTVYGEESIQELDMDKLDDLAVDTIAKATTNGSKFTGLALRRADKLSGAFINDLSSIVSRSELSTITFYTKEDSGRVRILESIQWKHLRHLIIQLKRGTFETSVMRTLVDGVTKMSEKVELDEFRFGGETWGTVSLLEGDLLQTFVASTSIGWLVLNVDMTLEQILSLLRSADVSQMYSLILRAAGFDSAKVDAILDGLQRAKKLRYLHLVYAKITDEQKSRMRARGVDLNE